MAEPIALAALGLDAALGWPDALYRRVGHPVGLFARVIGACERRWNDPRRSERVRRALGIATVAMLVAAVGGSASATQRLLRACPAPWGWIATTALAWPALAQRSLLEHVRPVVAALDADDVEAARLAVARIVGRDTAVLDEAGIARAAIESLAESLCDGVVAPLSWLLCLGLPGVWTFKAINTADSLIGHKEERWRSFGWAAARTDDFVNLVPARLSGLLVCIAGVGGWRTMWRDAGMHASPNAGWPEAAMAGALKIRLAGPVRYDGVAHDKPWIGDGSPAASAKDIHRALAVYVRACALLWMIAGGLAWAS